MTSPLGEPVVRLDGRAKVTGLARYATDRTPPGCAYGHPVGATIARGRVTAVHREESRRDRCPCTRQRTPAATRR